MVCKLRIKGTQHGCFVVDGEKRLFHMGLARLAIEAHASPVIEPVGKVTALLHFGQDDALTQGVGSAGGDIHHLARTHGPGLERLHETLTLGQGGEGGGIDFGAQAEVNQAVRLGGQDVPSLVLAAVAAVQALGGAIIRMDLNGERLIGREVLDQEWKAIVLGGRGGTEQILAMFAEELVQTASGV